MGMGGGGGGGAGAQLTAKVAMLTIPTTSTDFRSNFSGNLIIPLPPKG
jgi:hypothetical protein